MPDTKTETLPDGPVDEANAWLDLPALARAKATSENPTHPVDDALVPGLDSGWTAAQSGSQIVRLDFEQPQNLNKIRVVFKEDHFQRSQEFVLRCFAGGEARDIVRQQYNFNPPTVEREEYAVNLDGVTALELEIIPDISGGTAIASLAELRVA